MPYCGPEEWIGGFLVFHQPSLAMCKIFVGTIIADFNRLCAQLPQEKP